MMRTESVRVGRFDRSLPPVFDSRQKPGARPWYEISWSHVLLLVANFGLWMGAVAFMLFPW